MPRELSVWLVYDDRVFPDALWRDHLRAFNINWARTKSTAAVPIWHAIEGKGYVVWVSAPRWTGTHWRVDLTVLESAPSESTALITHAVTSALERFPAMRLEKPLSPVGDAAG